MNSLTFLYTVYSLSVGMLIISMIVTARYVIPLQLKQLEIKNGLVHLRKQLLAKGVLSEVVSIIAIICLTSRFIFGSSELSRYVVVFLIFVFCLCILLKSIIDSQIYHQQYDEESLRFHRKIEKLEREENK